MAQVASLLFAVLVTVLWVKIGVAQIVTPVKPLMGAKAEAQINKGVQYFVQGQMETARKHFQDAVKVNPSSAEAHYNLGLIFDKMGDKKNAGKHFQQAATHGKYNPIIRHSKILKNNLQMQK